MRRIAIGSPLFDRGRLIASLLGVALASTLGFLQVGPYCGSEPKKAHQINRICVAAGST